VRMGLDVGGGRGGSDEGARQICDAMFVRRRVWSVVCLLAIGKLMCEVRAPVSDWLTYHAIYL